MAHSTATLPAQSVPVERMPGHWLLARLGKRVLRPGGRELTDRLLAGLSIGSADDVVEVAPGLGSTTELVLAAQPRSYVGVDRDPVSARRVAEAVEGPGRRVVAASAADCPCGRARKTRSASARVAGSVAANTRSRPARCGCTAVTG